MALLTDVGRIGALERVCWALACVSIAVYFAARIDSAVASPTDLVGVLAIPTIGLQTPLYANTSELNLNRGAGLIPRMAKPGQPGNIGVASHRDGIFRPLENIRIGAAVEVRTASIHYIYQVTSINVVDRTDVALLRRTDEPSITLVTCYPFRFVGPAPRRFVVRGLLNSTREAGAQRAASL